VNNTVPTADAEGTTIGASRAIPLFGSVTVTVPAVVEAVATSAIFQTRKPNRWVCKVCRENQEVVSVSIVMGCVFGEFAIGLPGFQKINLGEAVGRSIHYPLVEQLDAIQGELGHRHGIRGIGRSESKRRNKVQTIDAGSSGERNGKN